jgi:hypothetical protein
MNHARVLYHLVRADFLERTRRYSFLLTLAGAAYLSYTVFTGRTVLSLDEYRGIYNSAWVGSMMTLVATTFLTLAGFYVVKNSVLRDQQTRVGQILATTPMSKTFYTLAKALSNFAVLSAMVLILAIAAVILQLFRGEQGHIQPLVLLAPFVLVALPAMAFTAALAILFETMPVLRGGVGNVIYFFVWTLILVAGFQWHLQDVAGFSLIGHDMQNSLKAFDSAYKGGFTLSLGPAAAVTKTFLWNGIHWTVAAILGRLYWAAGAILVALLAALFFHRFDPAREWGRMRIKRESATALSPNGDQLPASAPPHSQVAAHLTPILRCSSKTRFISVVAAELRLMLWGRRWWWYAVAVGLFIGGFVAPDPGARHGFAVAAWLWPVLLWSEMGAREARYATQSLIFSSAHALARQLPAACLAGVLVAILTGAGPAIRMLFSADMHSFLTWFSSALFIPSLALALGVWSGSSKAFEAIYTIWWYVGPANATPGLDFTGATPHSTAPLTYLAATAILLTACFIGRRSQLAYA